MIRVDNVRVVMTKGVQNAVNRAAPKTLKEAGNYVMRIARASIRQRKDPNKASSPGMAPHGHASAMNKGFRKTIVYDVDNNGTSAVIGPKLVRAGFSALTVAHEFGGSRMVREYDRSMRDGVQIGEYAPVTVNNLGKRDIDRARFDVHRDPKTGRKVMWIRIRTKSQAAHAKRVYGRLNKKYGRKVMANYPARPTMAPALVLALPKLRGFWRNAVKP